MLDMSDIHRPEPKKTVGIRLTASQWAKLRARARAEDRSLTVTVSRIIATELEAHDAE